MYTDLLQSVSLPKWPALVVLGKDVTDQQAGEILIRTDGYFHSASGNNELFDLGYCNMFRRPSWRFDPDPTRGKKYNARLSHAIFAAHDALADKLNMLKGLTYLDNSRIYSSRVQPIWSKQALGCTRSRQRHIVKPRHCSLTWILLGIRTRKNKHGRLFNPLCYQQHTDSVWSRGSGHSYG